MLVLFLFPQEELKINNLVFSLLLDEELNSREQFLNNYLLKKQEEKVSPGLSGICATGSPASVLLVWTQAPHLEPCFIRVTDSTLTK